MYKTFLLFALFTFSVMAQEKAPVTVTQDQCIGCHGPIEKLINKNLKVPDDNGVMVNPHVLVPHAGGAEAKPMECLSCHTAHTLPPKKGFKDEDASLEGCYKCHHNYELKKCSACHK